MNNVKKSFSIRDMENLSGIKAHTIRIWEKRYKLFTPERTDTNIRTYNIVSLQKLLNVTLLYNHGYKISKIAKLEESQIPDLVKEITVRDRENDHVMNHLKMAMLNFDQTLFLKTYDSLLSEKSFSDTFNEVFIPFLNELGLLWQTDTISPAHEHFISNLIKLKIYSNTEALQMEKVSRDDHVYALYLPENEIHELGLLYVNYEIINKGYKSIYLGQSMPLESLMDLVKYYHKIDFISYFTVAPTKDEISDYFNRFKEIMKLPSDSKLHVLGHQIQELSEDDLPKNVKTYGSIAQLMESI
ncbi:MerR family transcriptional regulator [Flagellimonas alvinocaridis]|uniref:MerR family transcriptional regulator n=1 Tax=Flagellimonas alvinocaridis TaxID=2530200 RepID=A0A4S8RRN3_9FLAO|nr:MerR family transcriptional regulator [Allomuricauda alvinocaridis]THV57779.1 MerR family transcriptional regulator [Allomuricauda alvinocaridis]